MAPTMGPTMGQTTDPTTGQKMGLSRREIQVLHGLADGCSYKQIALRLELAPDTITSYRKSLYRKLQVSSRSEAIALCQQSGLLPPATPPPPDG